MCVASLKSMTIAIKAQRALNEKLINSEIINLEPSMTRKGCAYGIKFSCMDLNLVENALKSKRIKYTEIINLH